MGGIFCELGLVNSSDGVSYMEKKWDYQTKDQEFLGFIATPDLQPKEKRPVVLIAHTWLGCDAFAKEKAREIARLGWVGAALDLYGKGQIASQPQEASRLMLPLFSDRQELLIRLLAGLQAIQKEPFVDSSKIVIIGFCFGGLAAIELFRSGASIRGAVSFHGLLGDTLGDTRAKTLPIAVSIQASLLVLHGYQDPLVSIEDRLQFEKEMDLAGVDWQLHLFGKAGHSFMNPDADQRQAGLYFEPQTSQRAWKSLTFFLHEKFL